MRSAVPCCGTMVKPAAVVKASTNGSTVISAFGCMVGSDPESGICWRDEIDMEKPGVDLSQAHAAGSRAVDGQYHFISTGRWRIARAKVRGNKTIGIARRQRVGR